MKNCMICGEYDDVMETQDYRGRKIWLCSAGDCQREAEREEQDAYECEIQEAHDEVDRRFGYY